MTEMVGRIIQAKAVLDPLTIMATPPMHTNSIEFGIFQFGGDADGRQD